MVDVWFVPQSPTRALGACHPEQSFPVDKTQADQLLRLVGESRENGQRQSGDVLPARCRSPRLDDAQVSA